MPLKARKFTNPRLFEFLAREIAGGISTREQIGIAAAVYTDDHCKMTPSEIENLMKTRGGAEIFIATHVRSRQLALV